MMVILGWSGVLLASLAVTFAMLMRASSRWAYFGYLLAQAPLASYALVRADYPMVALTLVLMLVGLLGLWRGFRHRAQLTHISPRARYRRQRRCRGDSGIVLGSRSA